MSESNIGLDTFYAEACELIQLLEVTLLSLETEGLSPELINTMFRAVHTIKGSGGLFGLDALVEFCHVVENTLDLARKGQWELNPERISALLKCTDHIRLLIDSIIQDGEAPAFLIDNGMELLIPLGTLGQIKELSHNTDIEWVDDEETDEVTEAESIRSKLWHISITFGPNLYRNGMEPSSFLSFLVTLGKIIHIKTFVPLLKWDEVDVEQCYLQSDFSFDSSASKEEIENVFEFIRDDSVICLLPPSQAEEKITHSEHVPAAAKTPKAVASKQVADQRQYIKVDSAKLDSLINLVGELVIAGAGAKLLIRKSKDLILLESIEHVGELVEQIRDSSLGLRMQEIDSVFQRFPRVIRDVSKELGKEIMLEISGEETELDKSIIEKLTDPLMHIVRNAMDHGLETAEKRIANGKDPTGKIYLSAYHDSGNVVIEVEDDGAGLDKDRILKKAIEQGIVKEADQLSEDQIYKLIFEPGFSTAEKITNISGRGVGMDVVRQAVQDMRGQIEIESERGVGSLFRIRLPLTLAIIDAFLVEVGSANFVIPLEMVNECSKLPNDLDDHHNFLNLRGEALPLIYLHNLLKISDAEIKNANENVVVVQVGTERMGIVVGKLAGELQAVIKPPCELFKNLRGIAGSTILGNGTVALMLDIPALASISQRMEAIL